MPVCKCFFKGECIVRYPVPDRSIVRTSTFSTLLINCSNSYVSRPNQLGRISSCSLTKAFVNGKDMFIPVRQKEWRNQGPEIPAWMRCAARRDERTVFHQLFRPEDGLIDLISFRYILQSVVHFDTDHVFHLISTCRNPSLKITLFLFPSRLGFKPFSLKNKKFR